MPQNIIGIDEYFVLIKRGMQPPMPEKFLLRGSGTDSLDIDLGKIEANPEDPMRVVQYRFEMMLKDDYEANDREWKNYFIKDVRAHNATYLVSELRPNTTYMMRVASLNAAGLSAWTTREEFTTLPYIPKISANSAFMTHVPTYLLLLTSSLHFVCSLIDVHKN